jgi:hypothetical protein
MSATTAQVVNEGVRMNETGQPSQSYREGN